MFSESSSIVSSGRNSGTQLGDKITSGEQINSGYTKNIQMSRNQADSSAEATLQFNTNQDNMEAFYACLVAETTSLSHVQDPQLNNVSVRTRSSEKTQKTLQILLDLLSKKFSLLVHPGRSMSMKDIMKYLLSLSPEEGISLRTKSVILQLSQGFAQWSLDYDNANHKLVSITADLLKAEKVKDDLEANVKDFMETDKDERYVSNQLTRLQEEKRDLEEKIHAIEAKIEDFAAQRDIVSKRKRKVFHKGTEIKAERDSLRNQVPRLKAEQEWAKRTKANIEEEWSKLKEQFIGSTGFKE